MVAEKITAWGTSRRKEDRHPKVPMSEAARMLNVGTTTVDRARVVRKKGIPELAEAVERRPLPCRAASGKGTAGGSGPCRGQREERERFGKVTRTGQRPRPRSRRPLRRQVGEDAGHYPNAKAPTPKDGRQGNRRSSVPCHATSQGTVCTPGGERGNYPKVVVWGQFGGVTLQRPAGAVPPRASE